MSIVVQRLLGLLSRSTPGIGCGTWRRPRRHCERSTTSLLGCERACCGKPIESSFTFDERSHHVVVQTFGDHEYVHRLFQIKSPPSPRLRATSGWPPQTRNRVVILGGNLHISRSRARCPCHQVRVVGITVTSILATAD